MRELALFAGAGGGILGGKLLGWQTVCAVEIDPYCQRILMQRQDDGMLDPFPIWGDIRTFDGRPWAGLVDVVSGGFPCQDISVAGNGAGIDGEKSGLWREMARIVGEVRPSYVFVENSPALLTRGLGRVLGDLAALGYDCRWLVLGAADVGAPHQRDRFWLVANADDDRTRRGEQLSQRGQGPRDVADREEFRRGARGAGGFNSDHTWQSELALQKLANATRERCGEAGQFRCTQPEERVGRSGPALADAAQLAKREQTDQADTVSGSRSARLEFGSGSWWASEPDVGRVANGIPSRVDRLRAIGNGQVPLVAATAWRLLTL